MKPSMTISVLLEVGAENRLERRAVVEQKFALSASTERLTVVPRHAVIRCAVLSAQNRYRPVLSVTRKATLSKYSAPSFSRFQLSSTLQMPVEPTLSRAKSSILIII